ncbi:MAG TPA: Atu4866 domain-containing protein [Actinoplanes sp.]|nr:Atu4866 domain-containing protein [Actinoplanes sp.]
MHTAFDPHVDFTVLDAASLLAIAMGGTAYSGPAAIQARSMSTTSVIGAWHSPDGQVRLRLHTDGTFAGEVAGRRRPARGTYDVDGESVVLRDDSGLQTPVHVHHGELEMAGHRLRPAG